MEPSPSTIRIIQDKYIQKEHFAKKGIALPPYMKTDSLEEVKEAGR
jgi:phosphoribosylaminoimidazole carboxylase